MEKRALLFPLSLSPIVANPFKGFHSTLAPFMSIPGPVKSDPFFNFSLSLFHFCWSFRFKVGEKGKKLRMQRGVFPANNGPFKAGEIPNLGERKMEFLFTKIKV